MSAFHSRAWGLEEDVAAHVQWSEAAGKNKLTADEVNDTRGMLQVRGLLPPPSQLSFAVALAIAAAAVVVASLAPFAHQR